MAPTLKFKSQFSLQTRCRPGPAPLPKKQLQTSPPPPQREAAPSSAASTNAPPEPVLPPPTNAPPEPVLPAAGEVDDMSADRTENVVRAIVAYNEYHLRQVIIKGQSKKWFKEGLPDVPVHLLAPLEIRKPDSADELLTYMSPWRKQEAVTAFEGTGTYRGGANIFWLRPFVDRW